MPTATQKKLSSLVPKASPFSIRATAFNTFDKEYLKEVYQTMVLSRTLDTKMLNLLKQGRGAFHIGPPGHEAIQLAVSTQLQQGKDWGMFYYRDMTSALGMGMTSREMLSAHLSKITDTSRGKQMPSHFNSKEKRIVSVSSAIGSQYLPGLGVALGSQRLGTDEVVYISSGDGATSQGSFFEMLNWATREKAPAVIVIQDNKYAISVPVQQQTAGSSISRIVAGFPDLDIYEVDGTDFFNSYAAAKKAIERARNGEGPTLIHAHVVRLLPHSSSDDQKKYRPEKDLEKDKLYCPIGRLGQRLVEEGIYTEGDLNAIQEEIKKQVEADTRWVMQQDSPAAEEGTNHVLYEGSLDLEYGKDEALGEPIVMVDAINHALHEEMERDEKVLVFGEDVADGKGGVFTATKGLSQTFGDRCFNSPLAEASIAGAALGLSVQGFKPVIEIQFGDYIWPAMQMLKNQIPVMRYRSNNQWANPMVFRVPIGGYINGALCHSQNIEAFFAHIPGFKVVMPSNAADAKGLLKTAIRSEDPILFLEHKGLYRQGYARRPEPGKDYLVEIGKASIIQQGDDLSIITYGAMVQKAVKCSKEITKNTGKTIEIIDIRTILPLDSDTILNSVKKTSRALVVHEDAEFAGFGAEIVAQIADECFMWLDAPVRRVAGKFSPIPYAPQMESFVLPQDDDVRNAINEILAF